MKNLLWLAGIIYGISACTMSDTTYPTDSAYTIDRDANFYKYKTFAWLPKDSSAIQNVLYDNQIIAKDIRESVNRELIKRGYTIARDTPDILLQYTLVVEEKEQEIVNTQVIPTLPAGPRTFIPPYNSHANDSPINLYYYSNPGNIYNSSYYVNNYPYYSPYGFPVGPSYYVNSYMQEVEYKEGTLILDVIDRTTGELVWRGWNKEPLLDPNNYERDLPREIAVIFRKFPFK